MPIRGFPWRQSIALLCIGNLACFNGKPIFFRQRGWNDDLYDDPCLFGGANGFPSECELDHDADNVFCRHCHRGAKHDDLVRVLYKHVVDGSTASTITDHIDMCFDPLVHAKLNEKERILNLYYFML